MKRIFSCIAVLFAVLSIHPFSVNASTNKTEDYQQELQEKITEIYYSPNSKIERENSVNGVQKTKITLEYEVPNLNKSLMFSDNEREITKEAFSMIVEEEIESVQKNRRALHRGEGSLEDSRGTVKGVVNARMTFKYAPINGSGINYYGIRTGYARYYPSQAASSSARSLFIGQVGGNAIVGTVTLRQSANLSNSINYQWLSLGRGWVADSQRVASLYGVCSTTAYGSFTVSGKTDKVSCTVSAF